MTERKTFRGLLWELHQMEILHGSFLPGASAVTYEMIEDKLRELEQFHYDALDALADELTPMSRADYRRERWES